MTRIEFEISDGLHSEAANIAAEMGLTIEDIAKSAFEEYLDAAQTARRQDLDIQPAEAEETTELQGTEPWLTTEAKPR